MNILFFINHLSEGGAQRVATLLAERFVSLGHTIQFLQKDKNKNVAYELNPEIKIDYLCDFIENNSLNFQQKLLRIKYKSLEKLNPEKKEYFQHKLYYENQALWLKRYLKNKDFQVIYGFLAESSMVLGAIKVPCTVVMTERNFPNKPSYTKDFIKFRNECFQKGDGVVFQTEDQKNFFPLDVREKSVVIPNPIKENLPLPYEGKREKVIVNFCRLNEQKNLPLLINAFKQVHNKYSDYRLKIYGSGDQKEKLLKQIESLGLSSVAEILPFDPNLHEKIKNVSMFVMSSDFEGMPNSLLEAMGIGLPVISTDCDGGGAKALIENHINGILTPKGDEKALAEAMIFYIENPQKAEEYSKKAACVREEYSLDNIAKKWLDMSSFKDIKEK